MLTTMMIITLMYFLIKDDDTELLLLISGCFVLMDYLCSVIGSPYYYERHVVRELILASICIWFAKDNPDKGFVLAAICCLVYAVIFIYEGSSEYQTIFYAYLTKIQFVLMQLYLIALTYKANWRLPCPEQLKSLSLSRNRSGRIPTTVQNECLQSDMEK